MLLRVMLNGIRAQCHMLTCGRVNNCYYDTSLNDRQLLNRGKEVNGVKPK